MSVQPTQDELVMRSEYPEAEKVREWFLAQARLDELGAPTANEHGVLFSLTGRINALVEARNVYSTEAGD